MLRSKSAKLSRKSTHRPSKSASKRSKLRHACHTRKSTAHFSTNHSEIPEQRPYTDEEIIQGRQPVKLNFRRQKAQDPGSNLPPLVILHGLLGQANNWTNIAGRPELLRTRDIYTVDLRDHGASPHTNYIDYVAMANDLAALITDISPSGATVIGHSMGGKAAAATALLHPHLVSGLALVDILPVDYHSEMKEVTSILNCVAGVDFSNGAGRKEIDAQLINHIADVGIRQWLLTNVISRPLDPETGAVNRWKPNITTLRRSYHNIKGFELFQPHIWPYQQPTALIIGGLSSFGNRNTALDIMTPDFPETELFVIEGAGHWVHAEKPKEFTEAVVKFLEKNHL